jgi:hypothetical protein
MAATRVLLVGINEYESTAEGSRIKHLNLKGCVNDALGAEKHLLVAGVPCNNITKLLSPPHDGSPLPTHNNIVSELKKIRDCKEQVDLLYIHYSAHGIALKGEIINDPTTQAKDQMWMALSTYDAFAGGKYLSGRHLGTLVQQIITTKGAKVCLILDSCFSGGGFRECPPSTIPRCVNESSFGGTLYSDEYEITPDGNPPSQAKGQAVAPRATTGSCHWMINPVGCTVLAACGMKQKAGEKQFEKGIFGAFTYWMLEVLGQQNNLPLSYAKLRHLVSRKIGNTAHQTPALRGEPNIQFLGRDIMFERSFCEVIRVTNNEVTINVGCAQGVAKHATYKIHSVDSLNHSSSSEISITEVKAFESTGILIPAATEGTAGAIPQPDDFGYLQTWALAEPIYVSVQMQDETRAEFESEITKTRNLFLTGIQDETRQVGTHPADFHVSTNGNKFEVQDEYHIRLSRLPTVSVNSPDAAQKIGHIIRHIARYKDIEKILNRSRLSNLLPRRIFSMKFERENKERLSTDINRVYQVTAGQAYRFHFTYNGPQDKSVWMAIFELNSCWGIHKLVLERGQNAIEIPLMENGVRGIEIKMTPSIPPKCDDSDSDEITDQFLVFVSYVDDENAPCWDDICLPSLPTHSESLVLGDFFEFQNVPSSLERTTNDAKIISMPLLRHWNVFGFRVCTSL